MWKQTGKNRQIAVQRYTPIPETGYEAEKVPRNRILPAAEKIPDRALKSRAVRHGRSAEAEHPEMLRQALAGEFETLAAELRKLTKRRKQTPAVLLRKSREAR